MGYFKKSIQTKELGTLTLVASDKALVSVIWGKGHHPIESTEKVLKGSNQIIDKTETQIREYLTGSRDRFDIPLEFIEGTPFQRKVWKSLMKVKFGKTWSYKDLAKDVGDSKKARAVGGAVGKNPLSIFVPCHRIIGSQGQITGFSGGLSHKRTLLKIEGVQIK